MMMWITYNQDQFITRLFNFAESWSIILNKGDIFEVFESLDKRLMIPQSFWVFVCEEYIILTLGKFIGCMWNAYHALETGNESLRRINGFHRLLCDIL